MLLMVDLCDWVGDLNCRLVLPAMLSLQLRSTFSIGDILSAMKRSSRMNNSTPSWALILLRGSSHLEGTSSQAVMYGEERCYSLFYCTSIVYRSFFIS